MADLATILKDPNYVNANDATKAAIFLKYAPEDPNYVNANAATKAAIFDKFAPLDPNYSKANPETQNAIRTKFGLSALASTSTTEAPMQRQNVGAEMAAKLQ